MIKPRVTEDKMRKTRYACEILGEQFATAKDLRSRCRRLFDKYLVHPCRDEEQLDENDAAFFVELVRLRDAARIPRGCYVKRVLRSTRDGQVGRHLLFEYSDGSRDMIGWSKLCGGRPATSTIASDAMRQSIKDQMQKVYGEFFKGRQCGTCPKTGKTISATGEWCGDFAVVHHDGLSFADIRDAWLSQRGISIEQVPLKDAWWDGGREVAPGDLCDSWKRFHQQMAVLVVVSAEWHRQHHQQERTNGLGVVA